MAVGLTVIISGNEYGFDFEDERIDIDQDLDFLDVRDLYFAIKTAQDDEIGIAYRQVAVGSGLDLLSPGVSTFLTLSLLRNWGIYTLKTTGSFIVGNGNLIRADGNSPFRSNPTVTLQLNASQAGVVALATADQSTLATIVSNTEMARKIQQNKQITDRTSSKLIVYEDDSVTPYVEASIFEDVSGTQTYRGAGIDRRDRLE